MLASIDDKQENNIIARNLVKQFNNLDKNVLIIDTLGVIDAKKLLPELILNCRWIPHH